MTVQNAFDDLRAAGDPARNDSLQKLARFGIATRGVVYVVLGVLAVMSAVGASGGRVTDAHGVLGTIGRQPFGTALLAVVAVGLSGYTLWRFAQAAYDPGHVGSGARGLALRLGYAASGAIHAALAVAAVQAIVGAQRRGAGTRSWLGAALSEGTAGAVAVGVLAAIVAGVAVGQFWSAAKGTFMNDLSTGSMNATTRTWVERAGRAGLAARGVVLAILAWFMARVALNADSSEWRGSAGALREIARQPHGMVLLGVVAAGLAMYGAYQIVAARHWRVATR